MIGIAIAVLTVIEVIVAFLLIGVILIQESKAHGGIGLAGGGMTETVLGASAGNVLTKATVVLASLFLGITLILAIITGHRQPGKSVIEGAAVPAAATTTPAAAALSEVEQSTASGQTATKESQPATTPADATAPAAPAASAATSASPAGAATGVTPAAATGDAKPTEAQTQKPAAQGEGAKAQP